MLDASGYSHRVPETDVYDSHNYEQDPAGSPSRWRAWPTDARTSTPAPSGSATGRCPTAASRTSVSEFGGIWWNPEAAAAATATTADVLGLRRAGPRPRRSSTTRFAGLVDALLDDPEMFGYCYTQLTDVFQEQNGIYRFDRTLKFDVDRVRAVQQRPAAYEKRSPGDR